MLWEDTQIQANASQGDQDGPLLLLCCAGVCNSVTAATQDHSEFTF